MVKPINKDIILLSRKAEPATPADLQTARDLLDTLTANAESCVGMAANMIGVSKSIIAVNAGFTNLIMFNPVITKKAGLFRTEEGCLSLSGVRQTDRYETIEVEYQDMNFKNQKKTFTGWTAQIIQHEVDHLSGRLI